MKREPNTIEAQAIGWLMRRDAGAWSAEDQVQMEAWLAADPRHQGAYLMAEANWLDMDRWAAHRRTSGPLRAAPTGVPHTHWALAAGLTLFLSFLAVAWYVQRDPGEVYASAIGEIRNIGLADGSRLMLNSNTLATVQFAQAQREISLERGEALFTVARDSKRPFVVRANDVQIKAIGTAFNVRVDEGRIDVLVTEGTVEVSRTGPSGREVRRVSARQMATLASPMSRPDIEPVQQEAIERKLAWREGKASFVGEPLSTAAAEINRHSRVQIHVDDPELAGKRVIGVFSANDAEAFVNAAAATFGAEILRQDDGIHLRPSARGPAGGG